VGIRHLLLASGHLETCVGTMVRAVDFGRAVRSVPSDRPNPLPERPAIFRDTTPINDARNAIEHLYDDLRRDPLAEGALIMPAATEDGFDVRGTLLRFDDLAKWLSELHALACRVAGDD